MALKFSKRRRRQGNPCMSNLLLSPEPSIQVASFWSKQLYGANFLDHPAQVTAAQSLSCFQNAARMSMTKAQLFLVPFINYFSHFSTNSTSLILLLRQGEGSRIKQANNQCSLRWDEQFKSFLITFDFIFLRKTNIAGKPKLTSLAWFISYYSLRVHRIITTPFSSTRRETTAWMFKNKDNSKKTYRASA